MKCDKKGILEQCTSCPAQPIQTLNQSVLLEIISGQWRSVSWLRLSIIGCRYVGQGWCRQVARRWHRRRTGVQMHLIARHVIGSENSLNVWIEHSGTRFGSVGERQTSGVDEAIITHQRDLHLSGLSNPLPARAELRYVGHYTQHALGTPGSESKLRSISTVISNLPVHGFRFHVTEPNFEIWM